MKKKKKDKDDITKWKDDPAKTRSDEVSRSNEVENLQEEKERETGEWTRDDGWSSGSPF